MKSNNQGFDNRYLFSIAFVFQGVYVLLSSFEFSFFQQKIQYVFTLAIANSVFLAIGLLILLEKKYLIISFISGSYFLVVVAFVMISTDNLDLSIVTFISLTISAILILISIIISTTGKKRSILTFNFVLGIIGLAVVIFASGVKNFSLFELLEDVKLKEHAYFGEVMLSFVGSLIIFLALINKQIKRKEGFNLSLKVALTAMLTALCVVLSFLNPFAYFQLGDFKPNPFVHMINAIAGVFLGPIWGVLIATFVAIIRFSVGIGTIHAFPGGIPGALVVGIVAILISLFLKEKYRIFAAFFEPIGTFGIGAIISGAIIGTYASWALWSIFLASSLIGSSLGFWILWTLQKRNININYLSRGDTVLSRREII